MASTSETGHARNVANFKSVINAATGWGAEYNPFKDALKLVNLNPQHDDCKAKQKAADDTRTSYNRTVSDRSNMFDGLSKLVTRALNLFDGSDALDQVKAYAKSLADKVRGMNNVSNGSASTNGNGTSPAEGNGGDPENAEAEEENTTHSMSQMSFVMRQANFEQFVGVLAAEPTYLPNENELKIPALESLNTDLIHLNDAADQSYASLKMARSARNLALYAEKTGLVDTALAVKKYVKGAYAAPNVKYDQIKGIKFTRPAARKSKKNTSEAEPVPQG